MASNLKDRIPDGWVSLNDWCVQHQAHYPEMLRRIHSGKLQPYKRLARWLIIIPADTPYQVGMADTGKNNLVLPEQLAAKLTGNA